MKDWYHKNKKVLNLDNLKFLSGVTNPNGFIYLIELDNGKKYIGKKNLYSVRKKNFGKKQIAAITDKRLKTYETIIKESDWLTYCGSSRLLKEDLKKNVKITNRFILEVATSKTELTYLETKYLFKYDVLGENKEVYYNDNILGKFYKKK